MKIQNLIKSVVLGIMILGGAIVIQSFTDANRTIKYAGEIYTNGSATGEYEILPPASSYDPLNCEGPSEEICAWVRTNVPGTVPESFNADEAELLHQQGLIEPVDDTKGVYTP